MQSWDAPTPHRTPRPPLDPDPLGLNTLIEEEALRKNPGLRNTESWRRYQPVSQQEAERRYLCDDLVIEDPRIATQPTLTKSLEERIAEQEQEIQVLTLLHRRRKAKHEAVKAQYINKQLQCKELWENTVKVDKEIKSLVKTGLTSLKSSRGITPADEIVTKFTRIIKENVATSSKETREYLQKQEKRLSAASRARYLHSIKVSHELCNAVRVARQPTPKVTPFTRSWSQKTQLNELRRQLGTVIKEESDDGKLIPFHELKHRYRGRIRRREKQRKARRQAQLERKVVQAKAREHEPSRHQRRNKDRNLRRKKRKHATGRAQSAMPVRPLLSMPDEQGALRG